MSYIVSCLVAHGEETDEDSVIGVRNKLGMYHYYSLVNLSHLILKFYRTVVIIIEA